MLTGDIERERVITHDGEIEIVNRDLQPPLLGVVGHSIDIEIEADGLVEAVLLDVDEPPPFFTEGSILGNRYEESTVLQQPRLGIVLPGLEPVPSGAQVGLQEDPDRGVAVWVTPAGVPGIEPHKVHIVYFDPRIIVSDPLVVRYSHQEIVHEAGGILNEDGVVRGEVVAVVDDEIAPVEQHAAVIRRVGVGIISEVVEQRHPGGVGGQVDQFGAVAVAQRDIDTCDTVHGTIMSEELDIVGDTVSDEEPAPFVECQFHVDVVGLSIGGTLAARLGGVSEGQGEQHQRTGSGQ